MKLFIEILLSLNLFFVSLSHRCDEFKTFEGLIREFIKSDGELHDDKFKTIKPQMELDSVRVLIQRGSFGKVYFSYMFSKSRQKWIPVAVKDIKIIKDEEE
jgi:hypothetical protein